MVCFVSGATLTSIRSINISLARMRVFIFGIDAAHIKVCESLHTRKKILGVMTFLPKMKMCRHLGACTRFSKVKFQRQKRSSSAHFSKLPRAPLQISCLQRELKAFCIPAPIRWVTIGKNSARSNQEGYKINKNNDLHCIPYSRYYICAIHLLTEAE